MNELITQIIPWAMGAGAPFLGWLFKKVVFLEKRFDKIDDLERAIQKHETETDSIKGRVSHIEIAVAKMDTKLDMILSRLSEK